MKLNAECQVVLVPRRIQSLYLGNKITKYNITKLIISSFFNCRNGQTAQGLSLIHILIIWTGINNSELDRIQQECHKNLPMLPINNIVLVGATGRENKTIRKQVSLSVNSQGVSLDMIFLVAAGLPFNIMIGCDILRRNSAVIDLCREKVSLFSEGSTWVTNLINNKIVDSRQLLNDQSKVNYFCLLYTSRCV